MLSQITIYFCHRTFVRSPKLWPFMATLKMWTSRSFATTEATNSNATLMVQPHIRKGGK